MSAGVSVGVLADAVSGEMERQVWAWVAVAVRSVSGVGGRYGGGAGGAVVISMGVTRLWKGARKSAWGTA